MSNEPNECDRSGIVTLDDEVKRVAAAFAAMGFDIVTGSGPGLMQAANEGAARREWKRSAPVRQGQVAPARGSPAAPPPRSPSPQTFWARAR